MSKLSGLLLALLPTALYAQPGVSFHQSNLPFIGLNYEFKNRLRPELRIGVDNYFSVLNIEGIVTYDIVEKEDYEIYAGAGLKFNDLGGVVIPVGINIYPFTLKQFGFQIELSPIVGEDALLRGSWGIRYRFKK